MEPVRPLVDAWVLTLLRDRTFSLHDFAETRQGVCRVLPPMSHFLVETAPTWARAVAPVAERIAHMLLNVTSEDGRRRNKLRPLPTRLTQSRRSIGRDRVRRNPTPTPRNSIPRIPSACRTCGGVLNDPERAYCDECLPGARKEIVKTWSASGPRTLTQLHKEGKDPAHGGTAGSKRGRRIAASNREIAKWTRKGDTPPDRADFMQDTLPKLKTVNLQQMARATGLSLGYCSFIRRGVRIPHPRHWEALRRIGSHGMDV
jgi:hypothetical protein